MSKIWPIYDHATHERQLLMLHAKPILAEQVIAAQHARDGRRIVIARVRGVTERDLYPALWRALLPLFPRDRLVRHSPPRHARQLSL